MTVNELINQLKHVQDKEETVLIAKQDGTIICWPAELRLCFASERKTGYPKWILCPDESRFVNRESVVVLFADN